MNASLKLNAYINSFAERWRHLLLGRGLFLAVTVFTLISLIAAYAAVETGFDDATFWFGRAVLIIATIFVIIFAISHPLKGLKTKVSAELEQRQPQFSGRIHTFLDSNSGAGLSTGAKQHVGGMQELLASDALSISNRSSIKSLLDNKELRLPYFGVGLVGLFLVAMMIAGPNMMNHSLRYLYAGWAFKDLLPPQSIDVSPGDVIVKRGGNITLSAKADGFKADELVLHVKTGEADWQQINMSPSPASEDEYDFSLFSIRESLAYYITSDAIRTPNYSVDVIDLPGISSVKLTYRYPEWTQLEDEVHESIGDISVLPGTEVDIEIFTDAPLPAGEVVLNGESIALTIDTADEQPRSAAKFTIDAEGDYYVAALIGGEQVRLSDDYFISLHEDQKPEIEFAFPGRDWTASNIEEVLTQVSVKDDFGIENIELSYAINGGEWQTIDLKSEDFAFEKDTQQTFDHLFFLEEFTVEENVYALPDPVAELDVIEDVDPFADLGLSNRFIGEEGFESLLAEDEEEDAPLEIIGTETVALQPGDLVSYYARVSDRQNIEQTDIFFIEVQPFDRRFSQAEQGGGGMAGGQGQQELEISQRQREIIVSTWNLIREQNDASADKEELAARLNDSTKLLAQLQRSLAEQAQSLIETARSRQLTADQRIETYTKHIENAIEAMQPASEELLNLNLADAIGPEQSALQHLLRADAVFNDVEVSRNDGQQGGQGGGGAAREELAEMFELEIDLDRNQYETGSRATLNEEAEEVDETLDELADLARRQEQLAKNIRNNQQITEAEQYQQELLRREAEQLQERVDRLQEQQQASSGAQGQQSGQGEQGQSAGQQGGEQGSVSEQKLAQTETSELNRRLQSALDAMDRAAESIAAGDAEQLQLDAGEAQRQLEGAGDQLAEDQTLARRLAFEKMAETANDLYEQQVEMEEVLLEGVEKAVAEADPITDTVTSPFTFTEEVEMANQKVAMLDELQRLKADMVNNAAKVKTELPRIARTLESADNKLKDSEVAIRMNLAADYMRRGEALYIANSEGLTTNALRSLRDSTEQALRALSSDGVAEQSELERIMEEIREGRTQLQEIAEQAQSSQVNSEQENGESEGQKELAQGGSGQQSEQSDQTQEGQGQANGEVGSVQASNGQAQQGGQPGQEGGQTAQSGQGGQASGQSNQEGGQTAQGGNAGENWGDWTGARGFNPDLAEDLERQLTQTLNDATNLTTELRDRGVDEDQIDDIRQVVQELQNRALASNTRDPSLIELNDTLALLEELEARVEQGLDGNDNKVRTESPQAIPTEYREAVADYYRRLSDDSANQSE